MTDKNDKIVRSEEGFEDFVDYADSLSTGMITEPRCKCCVSQHRAEAERKYQQYGNIRRVHRWLEDQGEQISYNACQNHFYKHFRRPELNKQLKEYAQDVQAWKEIRQDKKERIVEHIAMLEREIRLLASCSDRLNIDGQRKNAETMSKLMDQISKNQTKLDEYDKEAEPVRILLYEFENIIKIQVENLESTEARMAIQEILEKFAEKVREVEANV